MGFQRKPNMVKMVSNITGYEPRTQYIVDIVAGILEGEEGRKVLLLSGRRPHLKALYEGMNAHPKLCGVSKGYYVGGMKQRDLKVSQECQVILGTYQMASEALDIPALDTLVFASPYKDIEQSVGRILRVKADQRLRMPLIVDIADTFSMFTRYWKKRSGYYAKEGYHVDIKARKTVDSQVYEETEGGDGGVGGVGGGVDGGVTERCQFKFYK